MHSAKPRHLSLLSGYETATLVSCSPSFRSAAAASALSMQDSRPLSPNPVASRCEVGQVGAVAVCDLGAVATQIQVVAYCSTALAWERELTGNPPLGSCFGSWTIHHLSTSRLELRAEVVLAEATPRPSARSGDIDLQSYKARPYSRNATA